MLHVRTSRPDDVARLYEIWRSSVEATHHFLSAAHFAEIADLVQEHYLPGATLLVAVDDEDIAHGFMGLTENRIDALFVHADSRAKGAGRLLVSRAFAIHDQVLVDVNEQNTSGRGFYEHMGFEPNGRSETDVQGRPYPLLHLRWERKNVLLSTPVIRPYRPQDLEGVMNVFLKAIQETASRDYSPEQTSAWARPDRDIWSALRLSRPTWVAEVDGQVVGFTDLEPDGHIDMMYVHPGHAGKGVARHLLEAVEKQAHENGISMLYSEVSITARPFFEKHHFVVVEPERVFRNGQYFDRFKMEKQIGLKQ